MKASIKTALLSLAPLMVLTQVQAKDLWITADSDTLNTLKQVQAVIPEQMNALMPQQRLIARVPEQAILKLSTLMHEQHNRCGGFTVHESQQQALLASQLPISLAQFNPPEIGQQQKVTTAIAAVSGDNIITTIGAMSNFTNRYYTSSHGQNAAIWLADEWTSMVQGYSWASVSRYDHSAWGQDSVVLTLQGSSQAQEIVVLGGHLDSINGGNTGESALAPGADDNASGIATLTEILRVFMAQGNQPGRTIKFIGYAAEEVGLRGSQAIANEAASNNQQVIAVMQLDMTAYAGSVEDIVFMDDYTDSKLNQYMTQLLDAYLPSVNYSYSTCGYGCSDHASWHNAGFSATMPFESTMGSHNNAIHTANDTLAQFNYSADHALNFAKLGAAFALELGFGEALPLPTATPLENQIPISNIAGATGSENLYVMTVPANASQLTIGSSGGSGDADLYVRQGQVPTSSSYDCRPYKGGNDEQCSFTSPVAGDYYVMLQGYSSYAGLTLSGSYNTGSGGDSGVLTDLSASAEWLYHTVTVPSGMSSLTVTISGGTGDADLYLKAGSQPTGSSYACRPYKSGNEESCTINNPQAGEWYIGINPYAAFSGVTLNWQYQ
ncbi:M20/M25/M40 family metallo-hydrolase [Shewanella salipaludis]|uniref:M20/M25/M40 family metallo-hydrolase n=1 Tax=Shewanella salipaludis TaxID=2723052 RepID=A0A972JJV7_9GAMM|nr:M20/M25/M40 family metallo-hydrolase [Shewanella salipaludis]NMH64479.1 M20/M25/M40 family metallo-hydrolase [Shewanella salipaludis]